MLQEIHDAGHEILRHAQVYVPHALLSGEARRSRRLLLAMGCTVSVRLDSSYRNTNTSSAINREQAMQPA
jgi:hypothetical protein